MKVMAELYPTHPPVVDRIEYGDGWAKAYKDGQIVAVLDGISDISTVELYDENGNRVIPVRSLPSLEEQIKALSSAFIEMAGGIYG